MRLLSAEGIGHGYRSGGFWSRRPLQTVLHGVDFHIDEGESVGLLGNSGSGKSTLARLLLGLERPITGRVSFRNEVLSELRGEALRTFQRRVQLVFQDAPSAFNPRHSIGWSLSEPLRHLMGLSRPDCLRRVAQLLEQVGLAASMADRFPGQLSGGQLQRVGIARALASNPSLIVLDEALSNLDRVLQVQILDMLSEIRETQGTAFLLITHDLSLVQRLCHRVTVLDQGRLAEECKVTTGLRFEHPAGVALQKAILPARPVRRAPAVL
nr:nickel import ATP-binding protein NikE [Pseudomonas luteola]